MKNLFLLLLILAGLSACVQVVTVQEPSAREKASLELTEEGRTYLENSQIENAIRVLEQAISLNPTNGQSYYYLAQAWLQKGVASEAQEFNRLANIYLKNDQEWWDRVDIQAAQIKKIKKRKQIH